MAKSQSLNIEMSDDMEDEYIPMDPIYTEPPVEDETDQPATTPSEWRSERESSVGGRERRERCGRERRE